MSIRVKRILGQSEYYGKVSIRVKSKVLGQSEY